MCGFRLACLRFTRDNPSVETKIPEQLTADVPATKWGKVLSATPVVMTVIATLLAGLSSSEMTKAQYVRSLAAQLQSKAADQWGFFQAKRLRSAVQLGTLDVLQATGGQKIDPDALRAFAAAQPDAAVISPALTFLLANRLPEQAAEPVPDAKVRAALDALAQGLAGTELDRLVRAAPAAKVADALRAAQDHARAFDRLLRPVITGGDKLGDLLDPATTDQRALSRDFTLLRLRYSSLRYDAEARLNQSIANLLELQVCQGNLTAERHHRRSLRFFYGMLGAQAAVIIATFALAARKRNVLWSLAAAAGLGALSFAAYVFLFI